jgi:hypothetical protein
MNEACERLKKKFKEIFKKNQITCADKTLDEIIKFRGNIH